jgi:hypothetical protein
MNTPDQNDKSTTLTCGVAALAVREALGGLALAKRLKRKPGLSDE